MSQVCIFTYFLNKFYYCHLIYTQVSQVVASFQVTYAFLISSCAIATLPISSLLISCLHNHHISCEIQIIRSFTMKFSPTSSWFFLSPHQGSFICSVLVIATKNFLLEQIILTLFWYYIYQAILNCEFDVLRPHLWRCFSCEEGQRLYLKL
jgi:hypothetical protein